MRRPDTDELLSWLYARQRFGARLGLDRMRSLSRRLGDPHAAYRTVLVGGTNGKGTTAAVLAAALRAGGARVGLTTSPHLQRLQERVVVDGSEVPESAIGDALARVRPHAEELGATFFEVVTAAAMLLFAEARVDSAVLEVGLGGRFDATNIVSPCLSLVTGVALDHTAVLGSTLREIAHAKAGIFRPGVPAWTGAQDEALRWLESESRAAGVRLRTLAGEVDLEVADCGWDGLRLELRAPPGELRGQLAGGLRLSTPLVGRHQARNVALATVGALELGVPAEAAVRAAAATRWPGRLERLAHGDGWLVLDGAHNPEAAAALARALRALEGRVPVLVLGVSADKDVSAVAGALAPLAERVVVTRAASSPRAMDPELLSRAVPGATAVAGMAQALERARSWAGPGGTVVVAGSLFLVGEARALALSEPPEGRERWQ